jgi:hypothetical protein
MLNLDSLQPRRPRNPRQEKRLLHFGDRYSLSLGCASCPDRPVCGGLHIEAAPFDCLGFCCGTPQGCDAVCRRRPDEFAQRVREIGGFSLGNMPRAAVLATPKLPTLIPIMFHGDKRHGTFRISSTACLPLYQVICRQDGRARYENAKVLAEGFGIARDVAVVLTGTAVDPPLERWWSLGTARRDAIRRLVDLKVAMVTTPNFSLFTDQPRWDDMHSMKRIAIVHQEFLGEGLPAALHLNARTERDWERWTEYVAGRPEVTHVSFEFATGAGWGERMDWHAFQLAQLADAVGRPLYLILRGGTKVLGPLAAAFSGVSVLETSTFVKTMKRQRAQLNAKGIIEWTPCPTESAEMLDRLLAQNWRTVSASYAALTGQFTPPLEAVG